MVQNTSPYQSPVIRTPRLILRSPVMEDAPFLFQQRSDPEVNKYVPITPPKDIAEVEVFLLKILNGNASRNSDFWTITDHEGIYLGSVCLWNYNWETQSAELGFVLMQHAWHKGYATEAVSHAFAFAKTNLPFTRIEGWTHHLNIASQTVMSKNSMHRDEAAEALIDKSGPEGDYFIYSINLLQP